MQNETLIAQSNKIDEKLNKVLDHLKTELNSMRAGRANPVVLSRVLVDYYGTQTPLNQMANISVTDARTLTVSLYDVSALKEAKKAITAADLGLNPVDDGKVIRLSFPQLTEDRRKELIKQAKKRARTAKLRFATNAETLSTLRKSLKKKFRKTRSPNLKSLYRKSSTERSKKSKSL